jgi:NADH:ubiquinone oxidoreductase subunit F (NADH-binding)
VETAADLHSGSGLSAHVTMAGPDSESEAPPALVDNVETLANVPRIVARGAEWFRTEGTDESPGTIVCTITGQVQTPGVAEIMLGTTLREAIDEIGGGPLDGGEVTAVLPGVSGAIIPATHLDTPLTYEDMRAIGSGLGSAGYYVLDASIDPVAAIAGAVRFLSIESCGQCTPCKQDGMVLSEVLTRIARSSATERDIATVQKKASTVADGARCSIGTQQQTLVNSLLEHYEAELHAHVKGTTPGTDPILIAELIAIDGTTARIDERHASKQPDWTYEETWDGETPVDRFTDHRAANTLDT